MAKTTHNIPAYVFFTTQSEWKAYLQYLVANNDNALLQAIVCIDDMQTEAERAQNQTIEENDIGWTKVDAAEMGAIADKIRHGRQLTRGEMAKSRNKLTKYWKQLMDISKRRIAEKPLYQQHTKVQINKAQFGLALEKLFKCSNEDIKCGYNLCQKCPLTHGWQIKLDLKAEK